MKNVVDRLDCLFAESSFRVFLFNGYVTIALSSMFIKFLKNIELNNFLSRCQNTATVVLLIECNRIFQKNVKDKT